MAARPGLSVIIPTYNRAPLVPEAVASVLAQTWQDFEVLVVDDASGDGTAAALAAFGSRIRVLRSPSRLGVAAARNLGISAAQGQWLAFLDSDDLWRPEKLARQMAYLEAHPEVVLCQTEETWERRGLKVNQPRSHGKIGGWIFFPSLERCLVSPSAVILHRTLFQKHGGFDENLPAAEDYDLWLRLSWRCQIGLVPEALVIKRGGRDDQLSAQWAWTVFASRPSANSWMTRSCRPRRPWRPGGRWPANAPSTPRAAKSGGGLRKPGFTGIGPDRRTPGSR